MPETSPAPAIHAPQHSVVPADPVGLRLVIAYKSTKAIVQLVFGLVLGVGLRFGLAGELQEAIVRVHMELTHYWSMHLAEMLFSAATPGHLAFAAAALAFDGVLSGVEGWGLRHHKHWAPWLVVGATGMLVPFELVHLARKPGFGRAALLLVNLVIVVYLVQGIRRERALRRMLHRPPDGA